MQGCFQLSYAQNVDENSYYVFPPEPFIELNFSLKGISESIEEKTSF
jgi:hypothetical protein